MAKQKSYFSLPVIWSNNVCDSVIINVIEYIKSVVMFLLT